MVGHPRSDEDGFARLASQYDAWVGWSDRLRRELPFLLDSIRGLPDVLDVGCGTGVHAVALARHGHRVTGLDLSPAMLAEARRHDSEDHVTWILGSVADPTVLGDGRFDAVLVLGNTLLAFGPEPEVLAGLDACVARVRSGGLLLVHYLNVIRLREAGRLVVKSSPADETVWLRHHFAVGPLLRFHSYVLRREAERWTAEVVTKDLADLPLEALAARLTPSFDRLELLGGLTGESFDPHSSADAVCVARGRRA